MKENANPADGESNDRKHLRLSLKSKPQERFSFVSEDVEAAKQAIVLKNTKKCMNGQFVHSCATQRNECSTSPEDILLTDHRDLLCKWLCVFASETRKEDGCQPRSIAQIFARLQCYINANKLEPVRIVDPMNPVCKPLHQLLDRLYCDLHAQGIGTTKRQMLWETNMISTTSPQALLFAVFCYNGLNFVLRGGEEQSTTKDLPAKFPYCT